VCNLYTTVTPEDVVVCCPEEGERPALAGPCHMGAPPLLHISCWAPGVAIVQIGTRACCWERLWCAVRQGW
jgi:hypothetical protein